MQFVVAQQLAVCGTKFYFGLHLDEGCFIVESVCCHDVDVAEEQLSELQHFLSNGLSVVACSGFEMEKLPLLVSDGEAVKVALNGKWATAVRSEVSLQTLTVVAGHTDGRMYTDGERYFPSNSKACLEGVKRIACVEGTVARGCRDIVVIKGRASVENVCRTIKRSQLHVCCHNVVDVIYKGIVFHRAYAEPPSRGLQTVKDDFHDAFGCELRSDNIGKLTRALFGLADTVPLKEVASATPNKEEKLASYSSQRTIDPRLMALALVALIVAVFLSL